MSNVQLPPLAAFSERQQALMRELLAASSPLTIGELGRLMALSRNAVHQHLRNLEQGGYVERRKLSSTGGRPSHGWQLTVGGVHLFPKQYALFSDLLINMIKAQSGSDVLTGYLEGLGRSLAAQFKARIQGATETERIQALVDLMQEVGYEAATQPDPESERPFIDAHNCVYHHLASEHEEVCKLDLALMEGLSDRRVEHVECMLRGGSVCRFRLGHRLDEKDVE